MENWFVSASYVRAEDAERYDIYKSVPSASELYAMSFMINFFFKDKFYGEFYNNSSQEERAAADAIMKLLPKSR